MSPTFPIPPGSHQSQPSYYEILSLTPSTLDSHSNPSQALKRAYHRALLLHHPDKRKQPLALSSQSPAHNPAISKPSSITIDQISTAYATLSSPAQRAAYDAHLLSLSTSSSSRPSDSGTFQTGIEPVDLDDLSYDEAAAEWFRACRCGNPRGYRITEPDLEEAADFGEVMVGCADCSLWLRVGFGVVDDDGEEAVKVMEAWKGDDPGEARKEDDRGKQGEGTVG